MMAVRAGLAITGSFCTFSKVFAQIPELLAVGFDVIPIMSEISYTTDTRFGTARSFIDTIEKATGHRVIHTIAEAEPIGPQALLDVLIIAPCTGNTLGKLANGITDTSVTMAAKAHMRNLRPIVIAVSSNDALGASARNIGQLVNVKNIYLVPMRQDDCVKKPSSLVANMNMIVETAQNALKGVQIEPLFI